MVTTNIVEIEQGYAIEAERTEDGCKIFQDRDSDNGNAPITTMDRAREMEGEIRTMLEQYQPPAPVVEIPVPTMEERVKALEDAQLASMGLQEV